MSEFSESVAKCIDCGQIQIFSFVLVQYSGPHVIQAVVLQGSSITETVAQFGRRNYFD